MTAFVQDTMTGADGTAIGSHTGETGATWTTHPTASINGFLFDGRYRTSSASLLMASGTPATEEFDLDFDFHPVTVTAHAAGATAYASATLANYYWFCYTVTSTRWAIVRADGGTTTTLDSQTVTLTPGQTYHIRGEIRAGTQRMYVDDVLVAEAADTTYTDLVRVGIRHTGGAGTASGFHLDNFEATDYVAPVPPVVNTGTDDSVIVNTAWVGGGSFTDADSSSWTATVDYDDGAGPVALTLDGTDFDLAHTWTSTGTKAVTVEVEDGEGGIGSDTLNVVVIEGASTGSYISTGVTGSDLTAPFIAIISG